MGRRTEDLPFATSLLDVVGNEDLGGGVKRTARQTVAAFFAPLTATVTSGALSYATQSALFADLAHDNGSIALVYADPNPSYNGNYRKSGASGGGSWSQLVSAQSQMIDIGPVYFDIVPISQMAGGSVALNDGLGHPMGWTIPAGQTGNGATIIYRLDLDPLEVAQFIGARTVQVTIGFDVSSGYSRTIAIGMSVLRGGVRVFLTPTSTTARSNGPTRRIVSITAVLDGSEQALEPYVFNGTTSTSGSTDTILATEINVALSATPSDTATLGQENLRLAINRALARVATTGSVGTLTANLATETAARISADYTNAVTAIEADGPRQQSPWRDRFIGGIPRVRVTPGVLPPGSNEFAVAFNGLYTVPNPSGLVVWLYLPTYLYLPTPTINQVAKARIRVYGRPLANANGGIAAPAAAQFPGYYVSDVLFMDQVQALTIIGDTPDAWMTQPVRFDISALGPMSPGLVYFFRIELLDFANANVVAQMGTGRAGFGDSPDPPWKRGLTRGSDGTVRNIGGGAMIAFSLYEALYDNAGKEAHSEITVARDEETVYGEQITDDGGTNWLCYFPVLSIEHSPFPVSMWEGGGIPPYVAVPKVTVTTGATESITIKYNQFTELTHMFVDNLVLHKVSGGALMVEGVDYAYSKRGGLIKGLVNTADYSANAVYDWAPSRFNEVVVNTETGFWYLYPGTDRIRDPFEYIVENVAFTGVRIARTYTTRWGVTVIPTYKYEGWARRGREAEHVHHVNYNRRCLPNTFRKLRMGQPIRLAGYGDSITAISIGEAGDFNAPGGIYRDLLSHYAWRFPSDTTALIPVFDGPAGAGLHVHTGYGWTVKSVMESRFASNVTYDNWGVSGGKLYNELTLDFIPGALYPDHINALSASNPDLVLLAYGMNHIGDDDLTTSPTYDAMVATIQAIQAFPAGTEVLVITPPRPNPLRGWTTIDWWQITTRAIVRAARDCQVAYVDLSRITGPGSEAAIGLTPETMCTENTQNHPGWHELLKFGDYIAETFQI